MRIEKRDECMPALVLDGKGKVVRRELPADVYDTIDLLALAFGGIGADVDFADSSLLSNGKRDCPICVWGLAVFVEDAEDLEDDPFCAAPLEFGGAAETIEVDSEIAVALRNAGIDRPTNDTAVYAVNQRRKYEVDSRITAKQWFKELKVVRLDA